MNKLITLIDYNVGNILNVSRAFKKIGCEVSIAEKASDVSSKTDLLVLPGVGAFAAGMVELSNRGFVDLLTSYKHDNRSLMGICLGMQMLFESSVEMGESKGLCFMEGQIDKIPLQNLNNKKYPVPNVGWLKMKSTNPAVAQTLGDVYFVHSYYVKNIKNDCLVSYVDYGSIKIPAIVRKNNVVGFQFHPEKSGVYGLEMLRNYVDSL